jgi:hypothetical protein
LEFEKMKKIVSFITAMFLFSSTCLADCDFSKDIKVNQDGSRTYSLGCHIKVGQIIQDNATKTQQIKDLQKAVTLKNSALQISDKRADDWMNTALKLEENVQKIDTLKKQNEWISFSLGALTVIGAGIAAAQLSRTR